jgi:hypothetical protein
MYVLVCSTSMQTGSVDNMGEQTKLALKIATKSSLRTTVPMFMVKQWKLKPNHYLDWSLEICNGELVVVVRKQRNR